jgi:hypothetical protein
MAEDTLPVRSGKVSRIKKAERRVWVRFATREDVSCGRLAVACTIAGHRLVRSALGYLSRRSGFVADAALPRGKRAGGRIVRPSEWSPALLPGAGRLLQARRIPFLHDLNQA